MYTKKAEFYVFHEETPNEPKDLRIISSKEEFLEFLESYYIPLSDLKLDFSMNKLTINNEIVFKVEKCVPCSEKELIKFFTGNKNEF
jgi:hypothetical protein